MKIKLLAINCGRFNGMSYYQFGNNIFSFHLCTPAFNDYNEYRVRTEFDICTIPPDFVPQKYHSDTDLNLTEEQFNWWANLVPSELDEDDDLKYTEFSGVQYIERFQLHNEDGDRVKLEQYNDNPFEHVMYQILIAFRNWIASAKRNNEKQVYENNELHID